MFSPEQQKAIEEKIGWLKDLKDGKISSGQLEQRILGKRMQWFEKNKNSLIEEIDSKFKLDIEKAHYLIFNKWLKDRACNPEDNRSILCYNGYTLNRITIETKNFCSYLEALKFLRFNRTECASICNEVLEKPIQRMVDKYLNEIRSTTTIKFGRNYSCVRPYSDICVEHLKIVH
jgi:hypothetical protein